MVMVRNLVKVGNREVKKRYIGNKLIFEDLGDKTELLSGEEIYTDNADDSVIHVEVDGKSYQDGVPTPDYPIEIHSLNDFDVVSSVGGRNLLIGNKINIQIGTVTMENISDYHIRLTNEFVNNTHVMWNRARGVTTNSKKDEYLTFSAEYKTNCRTQMRISAAYSNRSVEESSVEITNTNNEWVRFYVTVKVLSDNPNLWVYFSDYRRYNEFGIVEIKNWKIEKGTTATPYSPAPEDITEDSNHPLIDKINLSLSEPLRSVGDVKDRLFRDSDGLWKVERKTKEVHMGNQYKTSRELAISETPEGMKIYSMPGYLTLRMNGYTTHINSTHFSYNPRSNRGRHAELYHVGMNGASGTLAHNLHFAVPEDDFPTLNSFNNWLVEEENSGTPVTLQIQSRPEDVHIETLDQELQDRLNNLRSFQDSNYVYTVVDKTDNLSENLKPTLHTTFKSKGWYDYYLKTLLK